MKRIFGCVALFSAVALGETWTGHVVDTMCKDKDVAGHTKKCAMGCAKSGFGLVTSDGKFIKFDETGNTAALEALKATTKDKDLRATVDGTMDGDVIKVQKITIE